MAMLAAYQRQPEDFDRTALQKPLEGALEQNASVVACAGAIVQHELDLAMTPVDLPEATDFPWLQFVLRLVLPAGVAAEEVRVAKLNNQCRVNCFDCTRDPVGHVVRPGINRGRRLLVDQRRENEAGSIV